MRVVSKTGNGCWIDDVSFHEAMKRARFWAPCGKRSLEAELAFLNGDTQLLFGSDPECCIWDINTLSCLLTFTAAKTDATNILPYPWFSGQAHVMVIRPKKFYGPAKIMQISGHISVETITIDWFRAVFSVVDGRPTFLEVRDDTLWEFDRFTERPLFWLPILWRSAYNRGRMRWAGPSLVFGLGGGGGKIGLLNIDSLRRNCTSIRRPQATT